MRRPPVLLVLALGVVLRASAAAPAPTDGMLDLEPAPAPSGRLLAEAAPRALADDIDSWFAGHGSRRLHIQLDRPLYRPGESVWVKTWNVATRSLGGDDAAGITYELVDPQGQIVEAKNVLQAGGTATNDFVLAATAPGGQWTLRARLPGGEMDERPFVVASYAAPRIHKTLEFVREAYGPGDDVEALVELERGIGGPLANHPVRTLLQVGGRTVLEGSAKTDATGAVFVRATLPEDLTSGDGLLTVLVEDGGVTESISRSVPILLADLQLSFFPEGGDLVTGLPGRVYFEGRDRHGEPADVSGWVQDDRGVRVAEFTSVHDGMGRLAFTPGRDRRYTAHVSAPAGLARSWELPVALDAGCTLRSYDDVRGAVRDVRVAVRCTTRQDVSVVGVLREQTVDTASVRAGPSADTVVYLRPPDAVADLQGALRVTVFDQGRDPVAERLVYRNPGRDLRIEVTPNRSRYGPRDEVVLDVRATGPSGEPVQAELALAVVDDAVLGLADDEEGHMLTRLYLEPELVESPKDPAWYFDPDEALAARGLDLVLGTRGHRRFEWRAIWTKAPTSVLDSSGTATGDAVDAVEADRDGWWVAQPPVPLAQPLGVLAPPAEVPPAENGPVEVLEEARALPATVAVPQEPAMGGLAREEQARPAPIQVHGARDVEWGGEAGLELGYFGYVDQVVWAPVRVFPRPDPTQNLGVRTDFRDTVHWEPDVKTGTDGRAQVRFHLSDAVASFRVTAEGLGGGYAGHAETTLSSVLPVSVATRLPAAVSAGDRLLLPLTVRNTRPELLTVGVSGRSDSELVHIESGTGRLRVGADQSDTFWMPVDIGAGSGTATLRFTAEGGGGQDVVEQPLSVVPAGFPRAWSASGEHSGVTELRFTLDEVVPDSLLADVTWHPSTMATLMSGMEGLIRAPGGCFEQTSSTNWPNVAILRYLEAHEGDPRVRAQSSAALDVGYEKLTGYQVDAGGFETWGDGPGKEALSAFGLLQFTDMQRVYPVADAVLSRDADYLLAQRDGQGGFKNSGESAHGYGSAPQAVLDGFITWALVSTGHGSALRSELTRQAEVSRTSKDPYVLALAARSLVASHDPAATAAIARLAALQAPDGSFPGAESSITRSYEANLVVESTALAALALMESVGNRAQSDKAANWLVDNRQGVGTWGATQATALALAALTTHADQNRSPRTAGDLSVEVNGRSIGALHYEADQAVPLVIDGLASALVTGENVIVLRHETGDPLPFTVNVSWVALNPDDAPGAELGLATTLDRAHAKMGETVRLTAKLTNRTADVVPSPIARIGLPAGLEAQTWQLQQLQERGEIAFFETRPREVTLYWDGLHRDARHEVSLDLTAAVPGEFTGPASSAYPYYDDDEKAWDAGLHVEIDP
jgi:hypothetical protein